MIPLHFNTHLGVAVINARLPEAALKLPVNTVSQYIQKTEQKKNKTKSKKTLSHVLKMAFGVNTKTKIKQTLKYYV